MRPALLVLLLVPVWALAPFFGSPASLWVMPLVAGLAAWQAPRPVPAAAASVASLALLVLAWTVAAVLAGAEPLAQARTAAGVFAMHALVVAPLAAAAAGLLGARLRRAAPA